MSKQISAFLLEDVTGLGKAGEIVTVAEGYARNALFPAGQAVLADTTIRARASVEKAQQDAKQAERLKMLQDKATILDTSEITFTARVREGDELYGSISKKQILDELNTKAGLHLQLKDIAIATPVKRLGSYDMNVSLSPDIECLVKVTVVPDATSLPTDDDES